MFVVGLCTCETGKLQCIDINMQYYKRMVSLVSYRIMIEVVLDIDSQAAGPKFFGNQAVKQANFFGFVASH